VAKHCFMWMIAAEVETWSGPGPLAGRCSAVLPSGASRDHKFASITSDFVTSWRIGQKGLRSIARAIFGQYLMCFLAHVA